MGQLAATQSGPGQARTHRPRVVRRAMPRTSVVGRSLLNERRSCGCAVEVAGFPGFQPAMSTTPPLPLALPLSCAWHVRTTRRYSAMPNNGGESKARVEVIRGVEISFEIIGSESGTPIVITPGGGGGSNALRWLAQKLKHGRRVLIWDR